MNILLPGSAAVRCGAPLRFFTPADPVMPRSVTLSDALCQLMAEECIARAARRWRLALHRRQEHEMYHEVLEGADVARLWQCQVRRFAILLKVPNVNHVRSEVALQNGVD
jgi:hypothetical protein